MKKQISILSAAIIAITLAACDQAGKTAPAKLDTKEQKVSYLMGYEMARQLQRDSLVPDAEALAQGARDALAAASAQVTDEELAELVDTAVESYVTVRQEAIAERKKRAHPNWQAGQAFLTENASKEGVVTLDSGLQYKIITEGDGASPTATDTVEVHYHGTLVDGTVFDSSVDRGETISFPLNRVISGWTEGLQLMKEGAKYEFYIPSELAYGGMQRSAEIGPHSTLVFEVELFKVNPEAE